jgi:hypothetical protein
MTLKEETLRTAVMGAMSTVVKDVNEAQRKKLLDLLVEQYNSTGNKSVVVKDLDGDKIATITLTESSAQTVITDQGAFLDWCRTHRPDLIETVDHPPVEGWTETRVKGTAPTTIAESYKKAGTLYVTEDMEPVDGVEYKPAPEPNRFSLTYAAKDRGLSVVRAWRDGALPIELDANLPRIGAS